MKHTFKLLLSFFILSGVVMSSCVKDKFDQPNIPDPCSISSGWTPNITVAGIGTLFQTLNTVDGSTVRIFPDSTIVLEAKVVSSDESGNIYKALYLEDATGAVMLSIEGTNLFNDFKVGQTVHLNLSGLTVEFDDWVSVHEIGMGTFLSTTTGAISGIGRIPVSTLPNILKNEGCPSTLTPTTIDLLSLDPNNLGRLVKLENVQVIDADTLKTYADAVSNPPASANIMIEDCSGNQIILRNSGYASFASEQVPTGKGSIVGIYTKYGSDYQLLIRSTDDVALTGTRCGAGGNTGGTGTGTGTFADPYDVEAGISNNDTTTAVWVQGFIVGIIDVTTDPNNFVEDLAAPFASNSNIYIASSATETDVNKMLIVQLPTGEIRNATNLVDNDSLLGKEIKYHGDLMAYFSKPGMKNTNGYWLIQSDTGIDPDYVDPGTIWSENFTSSLGQFTGISVVGNQVWAQDTYGGETYAKMTGYVTGNFANEDWLVSSAIDLSGKTNVKLNIRQAVKYITSWNDLKVLVSTNYTNDVAAATWSEIMVNTKPAGSDWTFVDSEDIDFSAYDGQTVYIAFKYLSTTTGGATWEIGKVTLKN